MANSPDTATHGTIGEFVQRWMDENDVPGASVALVDGDDIAYLDGFGARDVEENRPSTPETLYGIGSVTKSFTAVAILQLVEEGRVSLSDPVSEHLDRYTDVDGDEITIRELLTHSSGLPSDGSAVIYISQLMGRDPVAAPLSDDGDFDRHLTNALSERVVDDDRFFYYNSGYTVLGELIHSVTGESYEEYIAENVLEPLGMVRSTFDRTTFEETTDRMTPYYRDDGLTEGKFPFAEPIYAPGGLLSSAEEMARYLRMHMGNGAVDGARILSEASLDRMHEPVSTRREYVDGGEQRYGLGLMVSEFMGDRLIGHGGSIGVSNAYIGFMEQSDVGVVICCSTTPPTHPMTVGPALLAISQGEQPETVVPHYGLKTKQEQVAGDYEAYRSVHRATVAPTNGGISIEREHRAGVNELVAYPESSDPDDLTFYAVTDTGARIPVEFEQTDEGMDMYIERWRLHRT